MSLIDELRNTAGGHRRLRMQAADEIERLRNQVGDSDVTDLIKWLNDIGSTVIIELMPSHAEIEITYPSSIYCEREDGQNWKKLLFDLAQKVAEEINLTLPTKGADRFGVSAEADAAGDRLVGGDRPTKPLRRKLPEQGSGPCKHPDAHENFGVMVCLDCQEWWPLTEKISEPTGFERECAKCGKVYGGIGIPDCPECWPETEKV